MIRTERTTENSTTGCDERITPVLAPLGPSFRTGTASGFALLMITGRATCINGLWRAILLGIPLLCGCGERLGQPPEPQPLEQVEIHSEDADLWRQFLNPSEGATADTAVMSWREEWHTIKGGLIPNLRPFWTYELIVNGVPVNEKWVPENRDAVAHAYCLRSGPFSPGQLTIVYYTGSDRPDSIALAFLRFHEYGHLALRHASCNSGSPTNPERELEADRFAARLLCSMPDGINIVRHAGAWFSGINLPGTSTHPPTRDRGFRLLQNCTTNQPQ